ncbi:NrtR DNA-binding winged helix domain-containing protein [Companilactobacillus mishanensis]|uniref:NUDIX hydrolase n=1 Tax=Companilactobacillus mishanensis TaxID=2486008 RepID=A0ABW9P994_9LACO|nr:NUDIX domain-containing protein [Companilactobacillus mishanensis]MQS45855.1 NUDIX hydrolase [Companilactobacillus mishanensis]
MNSTENLTVNIVNIIWSFDSSSEKIMVLLIKNSRAPYTDKWGLPTTLLRVNENAEEASLRLIREKIGIDLPNFYTEQLETFSNVHRSLSQREIALTYMTYLPSMPDLTPGYGAKEAAWFAVDYDQASYVLKYQNFTFHTLADSIIENDFYQKVDQHDQSSNLISDHSLILREAFKRVTNRLDYLPTILLILGDSFTLKKAREVYATFNKRSVNEIDNSNFRKTHGHLFSEVGFEHGKSGRPAKLYKLAQILDPR